MLPSIEEHSLVMPLRALAGSDDVVPLSRHVEPLGGGFGNPVSLGLYRVSGMARDGIREFAWSLVLKAAQSPGNVGMAYLGGGDDTTHWNYWRREYYLYSSDLLDRLPHGLAAPRIYGVEQRPGDVYWLWMEEIVDNYRTHWPVERYALAARHLGRLSAAYLDGWHPEAYPWLARSTLRQWFSGNATSSLNLDDEGWMAVLMDHPAIARLFEGDERDLFRRCIVERGRMLGALDQLPQTLAHQDTYPTNLMSRIDVDGQEETVALDWALAGVAAIGSDLAQLFIGLGQDSVALSTDDGERLVLDQYLAGLRDLGWTGYRWQPELGFAVTTVLRLTFLLLYFLAEGQTKDATPITSAELDELVENLAKLARPLVHLAPRTLRLVDQAE